MAPSQPSQAQDAPSRPAVGAGDPGDGSFDAVVREHGRHVFNFLHQMTRHRHDAEDLTQQTFVKAFRSYHRFDPGRPMINWLLTIARRTALNHFRASREWQEVPESAASPSPSPLAAAEGEDATHHIWDHARRVLTQRQFEVLWLRLGQDQSVEETARILGLTQTHVKVLVHRARQQLLKTQLPS